jgi:hypothetical protein
MGRQLDLQELTPVAAKTRLRPVEQGKNRSQGTLAALILLLGLEPLPVEGKDVRRPEATWLLVYLQAEVYPAPWR